MATAGFFLRCYAAYSFTIFTWFHRTSYALGPFSHPPPPPSHFSSHRLIISLTGCLLPLFIFIFFFCVRWALLVFVVAILHLAVVVGHHRLVRGCALALQKSGRQLPSQCTANKELFSSSATTYEWSGCTSHKRLSFNSECLCVCGVVWCGYAMPFKRPSIVPTTPKLRNSNLFSIKSYQTTASMCTQLLSLTLCLFFSMVQTWNKQEKKIGKLTSVQLVTFHARCTRRGTSAHYPNSAISPRCPLSSHFHILHPTWTMSKMDFRTQWPNDSGTVLSFS